MDKGLEGQNGQIGNQDVWSGYVDGPERVYCGRIFVLHVGPREGGTKLSGRWNDWPVNGILPLSSATSSIGTIDTWVEEPWDGGRGYAWAH